MSSYSELLKDPRWQKVRLQVMERDGFCCRGCERSDKSLHVHHSYYIAGRKPWDYPASVLETLCVDCHKARRTEAELGREGIRSWEFSAGCIISLPLEYDFSLNLLLYEASESSGVPEPELMTTLANMAQWGMFTFDFVYEMNRRCREAREESKARRKAQCS